MITKEKIIEMLWHLSFQFDGDKAVIDKHTIGTIADTLLAEFEQEKKEIVECKDRTMQQLLEVQKREIFRAVHYELLGSGHSYLIKDIAKEYGVEL